MKFLGLVSSLAILIVILSPSIAAPAHRMLPVKRDLAVHVCQTNTCGPCVDFQPVWGQCNPLSILNVNSFESWGVDNGTLCVWYTGFNCTGTPSGNVTSPGYSEAPGFWKTNTVSWKCWS